MAAREIGAVRFRFNGDQAAAQRYAGVARTQLGILKELMGFGGLPQLSRTVCLGDGTVIHCQSVFGQDIVTITPAIAAVEAPEEAAAEAAAVNRVTDYVGVAMPNPVPYRGVSIGVVFNDPSHLTGGVTYITASDGTVLAQQTISRVTTGGFTRDQYVNEWFPDNATAIAWTGGDGIWMFDHNENNFSLPGAVYDHELKFTVPDDCIYPVPAATAPFYSEAANCVPDKTPDWITYWAAGIAAFNARRKAWFLKNSTEFMAALRGRFQPGATGVTRAELQTGALPASWDYQIKSQIEKNYNSFVLADGSRAGRHTKMPIVMSITYVDVVVSDTSANLTQAGTKVTKRTTTFAYTDAAGKAWSVPIDGTLTQVEELWRDSNGNPTSLGRVSDTYSNWYVPGVLPIFGTTEDKLKHQFLLDRSANGVGLLWNGVETNGFESFGGPLATLGWVPTLHSYSNTLVGTAPDIFLQYHNTVLPQYVADTAQSSTAMNNSAMYHVKQIELCLFGPAPGGQAIGIFPDPTDADGATQIAYYGEASFQFDWTTGALSMLGWSPRKDTNGNDAPTIIPMPAGYSYKNVSGTLWFNNGTTNYTQAYNCAIGYVWDSPDQLWPDVAEYLRAKIAQLLSGGGDQVLYTIIRQALQL